MALGLRNKNRFIARCFALEDRIVPTFANWSSIGPAIAIVPGSAGQMASVSVVNFGTTVYTGPLNVANTLNRIRANGTPLDSNDGSVYNNNNGLLPNGSWFEFVVDPSSGTDHNFGSQISFPGPMRGLLDTVGDFYFTGDHYSHFTLVYDHNQAVPTIGSFSDSPATVVVGSSTTLTASNVTEAGGTIASVKFYRESNGTSGLQTASDTLVGSGTKNGTTWTLAASTAGLAAGNYTYYAIATDGNGVTSSVPTAALTVTGSPTPTIGSFTLNPASVTIGDSTTLTARNVTETGGSISVVKFYRESNGTSGLQTGSDTLIGTGTQSGTTWTLPASTTGLTAGSYAFYAVATDSGGLDSAVASTMLSVTNPASNGVVLAWDVNGQTNFGAQPLPPGQVASGLTDSIPSQLTRGSGVTTTGTAAANAWGGANWATTSGAGNTGNEYVTFGTTVAAGHILSLTSIDLYYRHSGSGPVSGLWQYQLNGATPVTIADNANEFPSSSTSGAAMGQLNLAGVTGLQNLAPATLVMFRLVPYASTSSGGTWYVYDTTGNDLVVNGSVATVPPTITRDNATVIVGEGTSAANTGTFTAGSGTATISASVGTVTQNNGLGTWSWTYPAADGPSNGQTVTMTATNSAGGTSTTTFSLVVNNVSPTGVADFPSVATPNTAVTASITGATDPSPVDTAAGFLYSFDWTNDGTFDVSQSTNNSASYAYPAVGNYTARMRIQDKDGGYTEYLKPITIATPPTAAVQIDDGTVQRSMVQSITVTFSEPVAFSTTAAAAITLQRTSNTGPTNFVNLVFNPASGPASSFSITFDDATLATPIGSTKSLIDGRYMLTLDATQIQSSSTGLALDGNGDDAPGDNSIVATHRLFGDANGDGSVAASDFVAFRQSFNGVNSIFDFDGDGAVSASDFVEFRNRFNTSI